jgi:hypothetical protein
LLRSILGLPRTTGHRRVVAVLVAGAVAVPLTAVPAEADDPVYVAWSSQLPGWSDTFTPSSDNDCAAGRPSCLKQTLKELARIHDLNGQSCSHNAIFSLAYLRMTQFYGYTRDLPGYYQDVPFANHQDAVFARYYTDAFWNWRNGNRSAVPQAWLYAFDAAKNKTVTGNGDLLLGMSAHINRDLPFVIASVGTVAPDGSSRKVDYDKVEEWLNQATAPMLAEAAQRYDPTLDDSGDPWGLSYTTLFQLVSLWRENAWRNAESLLAAPTPEARQLVADKIEADANNVARGLLLSQAYTPPLSSTTSRDTYCAAHNGDAPPVQYGFGLPASWGY